MFLVQPQFTSILDRDDPFFVRHMKLLSTFSIVVLPDPVPPLIKNTAMIDHTAARNKRRGGLGDIVPNSIKSSISQTLDGELANRQARTEQRQAAG